MMCPGTMLRPKAIIFYAICIADQNTNPDLFIYENDNSFL